MQERDWGKEEACYKNPFRLFLHSLANAKFLLANTHWVTYQLIVTQSHQKQPTVLNSSSRRCALIHSIDSLLEITSVTKFLQGVYYAYKRVGFWFMNLLTIIDSWRDWITWKLVGIMRKAPFLLQTFISRLIHIFLSPNLSPTPFTPATQASLDSNVVTQQRSICLPYPNTS